MGKISGPLLDRIDIHIELPSLRYKELSDTKNAESSAVIKARVEKARAIQIERFKTDGISYNASMNTKVIKKYCALENEAKELLKMAMTELGLSQNRLKLINAFLSRGGGLAHLKSESTQL